MTESVRVPHKPALVGDGVDEVLPGALAERQWLRVTDFLVPEAAEAVRHELETAVSYERVQYGDMTRLWRAARPLGDPYFGPVLRDPAASPPSPLAQAGLAVFESEWFTQWLSEVAGFDVCFLRPPTPYRLTGGDRICLHDDMSDPTHAVSVAYNLTPGWRPGDGGETTVGRVSGKYPAPTPLDCPIDLEHLELHPGADTLAPTFNAIIVLRLDVRFAHSVEPVTGGARHSVTTIYGHSPARFEEE